MNELIRAIMRHERTLTRWGMQLSKDFARQKKINKRFTKALIALGAAFAFEDYNLYQTDKKVKDLERKIDEMQMAKENNNEE